MQSIPIRSSDLFQLAHEVLARGQSLRFTARGGSMRPAIRHGDEITVAAVAPEAIVAGDILMVDGAPPKIHRAQGINKTRGEVITQGDGCASADQPNPLSSVIGKVVQVDRRKWWQRLQARLRTLQT